MRLVTIRKLASLRLSYLRVKAVVPTLRHLAERQ